MQNGLDWFMNKDRPQGWDGRGMTHEIERLTAENIKLRAALEKIASMTQDDHLLWWQTEARKALAGHNI